MMDTITCNAGETEMIIGVSAGPRILSLRHKGEENLLYVDQTDFILASCTTERIIQFWPGTEEKNWLSKDQYMVPAPGDYRGKTGWYEERGWLAAMQPAGKLIIRNKDHSVQKHNNNLEIFACKDYAELETLSPQQTIAPGISVQHLQHWHIFI